MFWLLLLLAAALGAAYYRWSRRRLYRLARELPSGLKEYPLVGHGYMFLGSSQAITDPEAIEAATRMCLAKDDFTYRFLRTVTGNGSIFAPVSIWHPRRKISAPFFSLNNLNQLIPVFYEKSSLMADLMRSEAGGGDFPIWKYMTTYTFDAIFETIFSTKINTQQNPEHFALQAIDTITHMVSQRMLQPWLHPDFVYQRLSVYKQFESSKQACYAFVNEVIREKRKTFAAREGKKGNDRLVSFADMIIENSGGVEKGFSDLELREECIVMAVAGTDTSAVGSSFTAVLLSRYPDVQDRVYRELKEVFGDSNRQVTRKDLNELKYLEAVIKESLRLYPPVPAVAREVHNDTTLPSGTTLLHGTGVMINIWGTNRNPLYWGADAELFRPERFLEGPLRHPAQFIPFSYSVRNCIGRTYAMLSAKTVLANLLRRYRLLPPADMADTDLTKPLRVEFSLMMKAADNFIVRIEERNKIK